MQMPIVHVDRIGGVPVVWTDGPVPVEAALVFGSGVADETFTTAGVGHLVEHLVMARLPRHPAHEVNASVRLHSTRFWSSGPATAVSGSLLQIAESIAHPDASRRSDEVPVLEAEGGTAVPPPLLEATAARYGYHGPALAAVEPRLGQLSDEAVLAHWRTHLVRGNAAIALTAPPDTCGVDLEAVVAALPEGPPPRHETPEAALPRGPRTVPALTPAVTLSFDVPDSQYPAVQAVTDVLLWRLEDALRYDAGLAYHVDAYQAHSRDDRVIVALSVDRDEEDTAAALAKERRLADRMRTVVDELFSGGPTDQELTQSRDHLEASALDPRAWPDIVASAAGELLITGGVRQPGDVVAEVAAQTRASVHDLMRACRTTLLLHIPSEPDGPLPWPLLDDEEEAEPVPGRRYGRKLLSLAPRAYAAVVGDEGFSLRDAEGWRTVRWDELVGLGRHEDVRSIVTRDGRSIDVQLRGLSGGTELGAAVDERVPRHLWFDLSDDEV